MGKKIVDIRIAGNPAPQRALAPLVCMVLTGCGFTPTPNGPGGLPPSLSLSVSDAANAPVLFETDPNDLFETAELLNISVDAKIVQGRIDTTTDVDIFDLGPVSVGDRVVVTMNPDAALNGAIALFDGDGIALLVNDHRNVYLGRTTPFVDVVVQHDSLSCFVAVTTTPGFSSTGDYTLTAFKEPNTNLPIPRPDTVLLVFNGASNVRVGGRAALDVPIFSAESVDPAFEGQTDELVERIVDYVREDFEGLDVTILSTSEGDVFQSGMTRIYFGTFDAALLGVADGVDEFNSAREQNAIVFTTTFSAFSRLNPAVEEMGQALANVASHEIGHLLGMIHTIDAEGIMDVTASLRQLLNDQTFSLSPIYAGVFPLGYQDGVQQLYDVLGGDPDVLFRKNERTVRRTRHDDGDDDYVPARAMLRLSTCNLSGH